MNPLGQLPRSQHPIVGRDGVVDREWYRWAERTRTRWLFVTVTGDHDAQPWQFICADTTASAISITLPLAARSVGSHIGIKLIGTANVVVGCQGAETIDRAATVTLVNPYEYLEVISDGAEWWVT